VFITHDVRDTTLHELAQALSSQEPHGQVLNLIPVSLSLFLYID